MRFRYLVVLAAAVCAASTIDAAASGSECTPAETEHLLPAFGNVLSLGAVANGAVLEVREHGQSIDVLAPSESFVAKIGIPLRNGFFVVGPTRGKPVTVGRIERNSAPGRFEVRLHCPSATGAESTLDIWSRLDEIATQARGPLDTPAAAALMAKLDALAQRAPAASTALIQHMRAQLLLVSGQYALAATAFARAETAWLEVGDADRAAVARVGQAEEAQRTGDYARVLELAPMPSPRQRDVGYFKLRLTTARCMALDYLGRYADADLCYEWTLPRLRGLDEQLEYANTLRNYAFLRWETGHANDAESIAAQALDAAHGTNAAVVTGRVHAMMADIRLSRGDVVGSLHEADAALGAFIEAKSQRWQVDALLKIASVYGELGAYDDAYVAVRKAVAQISPKDTPARVGAALVAMAEIDLMNDDPDRAAAWARSAERLYAGLKMPAEREEAHWLTLRAALAQNDLDAVDAGLASPDTQAGRHRSDRALLRADLAVRRGETRKASKAFDELRTLSLRLPERIHAQTLESIDWWRRGDAKRADAILAGALSEINRLAGSTDNPILRYLLNRESQPLTNAAFESLLASIDRDPAARVRSVEVAWHWLALTHLRSERGPLSNSARPGNGNFDAAVARELLGTAVAALPPGAKGDMLVEHNRLALFAHSNTPQRTASAEGAHLSDIQAGLDEGTVLIAYLQGKTRGALLVTTGASAIIVDSIGPDALQEHATRLRALQSPDTSALNIDGEARSLSSALWGRMPFLPVPKKIIVLAGSPIDALPLSLLYWPGQSLPLAETTALQVVDVEPASLAARAAAALPDALHVVVAAQDHATTPTLPTLFNAHAEPAAIKRGAAGLAVRIEEAAASSRENVLTLLQRPGGWIHIAAHGAAQPNRLGYAGVWLDSPMTGQAPEFLSWLEVLNRGVRSDLVVLNACSLADSGDAFRNNLSFASAVSNAGARQVVAALWPLSDSASAIWVPAFYATLVADPQHDAAAAVGAAQRALRGSRLYRHPFYWASLAAFGHLEILPGKAPAKPGQWGTPLKNASKSNE